MTALLFTLTRLDPRFVFGESIPLIGELQQRAALDFVRA